MTSVSNRFSLLVVDDGRKKKAPSKPASAPSQPAASNVKKPEAKQSNEPKPQQQQKSSVPKQDTGKKQPQQKDTGAPKGDQPKGPRSDLPPRRGERREHKESEQPRQPRQPREPREPREGEQPREPRQPRQQREPRDGEQPREFRPRQPREPREPRDGEQPRERKPRPRKHFILFIVFFKIQISLSLFFIFMNYCFCDFKKKLLCGFDIQYYYLERDIYMKNLKNKFSNIILFHNWDQNIMDLCI